MITPSLPELHTFKRRRFQNLAMGFDWKNTMDVDSHAILANHVPGL